MVEDPFSEPLEAFVIEVATAVEPHPWRARNTNAISALDDVLERQHVRPPEFDATTERGSIVGHENGWDGGSKHVAEVPQIGARGATDDGLGIRTAGGRTAGFERVGRGRHSVDAAVHTPQCSRSDEPADRVVADSIGEQLLGVDDPVGSGHDRGEVG